MPEESALAQLTIDTVKVEKLVREFLMAQNLTILPQNLFGDAVAQYVDKDDRHAMDLFVSENLGKQIKHLVTEGELTEEEMLERLIENRSHLEDLFTSGHLKNAKSARLQPKPDHWDSDLDGSWEDSPAAFILAERNDDDEENEGEENGSVPPRSNGAQRDRGKANGTAARRGAATSRAAPKARGGAAAKTGSRSKAKVVEEDEEDDDDDIIMIDDDDDVEEEDEDVRPPSRKTTKPAAKSTSRRTASPVKRAPAHTTKASQPTGKQSKLNFSQPTSQGQQTNGRGAARKELVSRHP